ncbi:MAG: exodeoxyribonuclease VII small subunit [Myxococcota bacterium]|nr:exodeoxyribonuclease VII small subunit [Myxococcales bacterium]
MAKAKRAAAGDAAGSGETGPPTLSFEGALEQLEQTVQRLEEGEMPLEEALALFEQGVGLSRQCATTLEAAERRIEILVADRGGATRVASFDAGIDAGSDAADDDTDLEDDEDRGDEDAEE